MASPRRLSVNLNADEYRALSAIAEHANLSLAWVGRKAIQDFLNANDAGALQLPLALAKRTKRVDR